MRVIISTMGTMGDVNPYIGMGIALKKQGHDVAILACEKFENAIRKEGLKFFSVNSTENFEKLFSQLGIGNRRKLKLSEFKKVLDQGLIETWDFWLQAAKPTYEYICREYIPGQTVLIADTYAWGAKLAHDKLGIPLITTFINLNLIRSAAKPPQISPLRIPQWLPRWLRGYISNSMLSFVQDRFIHPVISQMRQELGLENISLKGDKWMFSSDKVFGMLPEWFAQPQADWLPQIELVGFPFYDQSADQEMSSEIKDFLAAGKPPIVFSPGSYVKGEAFFKQSAMACKELGKRAIFVSPNPHALPKEISASIRYFGYLPFSKILPHAAAMVYHGGTGSFVQTCRAGIPHLIIPGLPDQFHNATRVKELGIGDAVSETKYFSSQLVHKLKKITESENIKARCQEIARLCEKDDAYTPICRIVEKIAASQSAGKQ